jgi:hypothetical protein
MKENKPDKISKRDFLKKAGAFVGGAITSGILNKEFFTRKIKELELEIKKIREEKNIKDQKLIRLRKVLDKLLKENQNLKDENLKLNKILEEKKKKLNQKN